MPPRRSARQSMEKNDDLSQSTDKKRSSKSVQDADTTPRPVKHQKRGTANSVTPKKSPHFAKSKSRNEDIDETDDLDNDDVSSSSTSEAGADSEFEAAEQDSLPSSSDDDNDADDFIDDDRPTSRRKKVLSKKSKASPALSKKKPTGELWRAGADTGLEPGTEIVIKKPKARPAGKTPYKDETIHPNTFLFLRDLKANNDREWLKMHDPDYRASLNDWTSFVEKLTEKLTEIDETIPELPVKDIVFRIYRDIRFSKDPTPYKTYYSAAWSRTGRKGPYAAYYLQIAPGNSFIGGGCWFPEAQYLASIRENINRRPHKLKAVLSHGALRREFLGGVPEKPDKVVKAFVSAKSNAESALKTKPKGYEADHRDIELLRLRSFTIGRSLKEEEIIGSDFMARVVGLMTIMEPFITHLNSVVMPDHDQSESGEPRSDEESDSQLEVESDRS